MRRSLERLQKCGWDPEILESQTLQGLESEDIPDD